MSTKACPCPRLQLTKLLFYINFLLWLLPSQFKFLSTADPGLPPAEVKALDTIIQSITVATSAPALPNIDANCCQLCPANNYYFEISCTPPGATDHITKLVVNNKEFDKEILEELGDLTYLAEIDLSNNKLTGTIPDALSGLFNLTYLDLSYNQLTGSIPEFIGNLQYLNLEYNLLNDTIPQSLGTSSKKLERLRLGNNRLSGTIPKEFGQLVKLRTLSLYGNRLDGDLPDELKYLKSLRHFDVEGNSLNGIVPKSYEQLESMREFSISGNNISCLLPVEVITKWPNITYVSLMGNEFQGNLTQRLFNLPTLEYLYISDLTNASFQFPLNMKAKFTALILRNCGINGSIPKAIGEMSSLEYLDLSFNKLTGEIPEFVDPKDLDYISFASNMLSGKIPSWIVNAVPTQTDISFNNFSAITQQPNTEKVNLFACCRNSPIESDTADEKLWSDPFPRIKKQNCCATKKGNCYRSLYINCGGGETGFKENSFEADSATSLFSISPKKNWAYSSSGGVWGLGNSSEYLRRKCANNSDEGFLYNDARLSPTSLRYYAFCLREGNYTVKLWFAEIVSTEDADESNFQRTFDIFIQGQRKIEDFNIKECAGGLNKPWPLNFTAFVNKTDSLLEIHLYWTGKGSLADGQGPLISAISVVAVDDEEKLKPLHIALIAIASTSIFLLLLLAFALCWLRRKKLAGQQISVPVKELIAATGKFSNKKKIGIGDFGIVYEAKLQGQTVAVTKLSSYINMERIKELKNEIFTIGSLEHNNLLKLWDVHIEKGLKFLVYEYMENKSLADALFGSKSRILKLPWQTRFNICLGIARGLEYLHEHPRLKIVHMNIKSGNILLDGKLEAKISDFGLASIYTEEHEVMIIKNKVSQGYMAPEYVQGNITSKTDVYSFGVVILEIVSGKKNVVSKSNQESEVLLDMAYKAHENGKLLDLVDQNLGDEYDTKQVLTVLNLALKCTSVAPSVRPQMSAVVSVLLGKRDINQILQPSSNGDEKTKAGGDHAKAVSNTSIELASIASTSSPSIKGTDEVENM